MKDAAVVVEHVDFFHALERSDVKLLQRSLQLLVSDIGSSALLDYRTARSSF